MIQFSFGRIALLEEVSKLIANGERALLCVRLAAPLAAKGWEKFSRGPLFVAE
jgi:hypothetical protein